jgi:hypothetical protein
MIDDEGTIGNGASIVSFAKLHHGRLLKAHAYNPVGEYNGRDLEVIA